jgi:hypothetical protein
MFAWESGARDDGRACFHGVRSATGVCVCGSRCVTATGLAWTARLALEASFDSSLYPVTCVAAGALFETMVLLGSFCALCGCGCRRLVVCREFRPLPREERLHFVGSTRYWIVRCYVHVNLNKITIIFKNDIL